MINAAIVGLGWWGKVHVESIQGKSERIRYVRGVTKEPEDVAEWAKGFDLPLTTEYDDVVADPNIDAVVLATPHSLHTGQIAAAAAAGKQIFCEKPFALNKAEAEASIAACRDAGVALGLGQNRRFWPSLAEIRRMVTSGELGTVMQVDGTYSHDILADVPPGTWRTRPDETPAGGMTGMGIHITDAFISMVGPIAEVTVRCTNRTLNRESGDTVAALFTFENGALGYLGTTLETAFIWHYRVFGSNGWAETRGENDITVCMRGGQPETRMLEPVDSVLAEMEAFCDAVENRAPYPIPQADMVHNVAVLEAVFESAKTGEPVKPR